MSTPHDKVRLGGMALQNGILVHSFDHWAVAVRGEDGEVKLASGRKPELPAAITGTPLLRGVARLAEVAYLLPTIRRRLPEARLPMESPGMGAALAGSVSLDGIDVYGPAIPVTAIASSAPSLTQAAHFSSVPAVAKTRFPIAETICTAVTPMTDAPPCTRKVSPGLRRARSKTLE